MSSGFRVRYGAKSVTGRRPDNEDSMFAGQELGLFMVADGMGGQLAGEQASRMAVDLVPARLDKCFQQLGSQDDDAIAQAIRESVLYANQEIMALASIRPDYQNMGTTCVLMVVRDRSVYIAGIGDSRAYLARGKTIDLLTTDHSLAQALLEAGTITPDEVSKHRFRNILWKYLGSKEVGEGPDVVVTDAAAGDRFVLASDGLTGVVSDKEIHRILMENSDPRQAADALIQQAIDNDSQDNISCIVIYLEDR